MLKKLTALRKRATKQKYFAAVVNYRLSIRGGILEDVLGLDLEAQVLGLGFEAQVLGIGLEAHKSSKMISLRLEDNIIF